MQDAKTLTRQNDTDDVETSLGASPEFRDLPQLEIRSLSLGELYGELARRGLLTEREAVAESLSRESRTAPRGNLVNEMPWWQMEPCPSWCGGGHSDGDQPDERKHWGTSRRLEKLVLMPLEVTLTGAQVVPEPACLDVYLAQSVREVEPHVSLSVNECAAAVELTMGEVVWLRDQLTELLASSAQAQLDGAAHG